MSLYSSYNLEPFGLSQCCPDGHQPGPWDHFGLAMNPAEIQLLASIPLLLSKERSDLAGKLKSDITPKPIIDKNGFQVLMNVQQFQPNEITVKSVGDLVVVEAKHEEREDEHGHISRHFVRKYKLPKDYDSHQVTSTLSSDGILTIKAPPPAKELEGNERVIQIQQTGPAHFNITQNKLDEK